MIGKGRTPDEEVSSFIFIKIFPMGMEEETSRFFVLIANSIALLLVWMIANILVGIYWNYAFFEGSPHWKNIVYYLVSVIAFFFVARHIIRKWKKYF